VNFVFLNLTDPLPSKNKKLNNKQGNEKLTNSRGKELPEAHQRRGEKQGADLHRNFQ
jgi:hypothetical protein